MKKEFSKAKYSFRLVRVLANTCNSAEKEYSIKYCHGVRDVKREKNLQKNTERRNRKKMKLRNNKFL